MPTATATPTPNANPTSIRTPRTELDTSELEQAGRINLLVLGIDKADAFVGNTDVMMIVSIDPTSGSIFILSIPRDLCLGACEDHASRISAVYKLEGLEALKQTIRNVTGLRVDHWLLVNFYGVETIIDRLGGVRVWSNREFDERFVYLDTDEEIRLILEGGWNTLNGREAVAYGRSRKYDGGGDFARICRQQQVIRALREQALSPALIVNAPGVIAGLNGTFKTDFPIDGVPALAELLLSIPPERINSWAIHARDGELLVSVPGLDGANLLRPDLDAIRDFVRDALTESTREHADREGNATFIRENCRAYYPA